MYLTRLSRGGERYYLSTVAPGAAGSEPGFGNPPGRWLGAGAERVGLEGTVDGALLRAVLDGTHPTTGAVLSTTHARVRVVGWDCTFSAPKAVSVLWGLAERDVATAVQASHERAVRAALAHLEGHALGARRRRGGVVGWTGTHGALAAGFLHGTSRAGDPHLHTHVLLANLVEGEDGRWSALESRWIFRELPAWSQLYRAQLRFELARELGRPVEALPTGAVRVPGVDRALVSEFSRRELEVARRLAAWEAFGPSAAHAAAVATREPGASGPPRIADLRIAWRQRAQRIGRRAIPASTALAGPVPASRGWPGERATARLVEEAGGATGWFRRRDLTVALCRDLSQGAPVRLVDEMAERILGSGAVVPVRDLRAGAERWWLTPRAARAQAELLALTGPRRAAGGDPVEHRGLRGTGVVARDRGGKVTVLRLDGSWTESVPDVERAVSGLASRGSPVVALAPTRLEAARFEAASGAPTRAVEDLGVAVGPLRASSPLGGAGLVLVVGAEQLGPAALLEVLARCAPSPVALLVSRGARSGPGRALLARLGELEAVRPGSGPEWREAALAGAQPGPLRLHLEGDQVVLAPSAVAAREALVRDWVSSRRIGRDVVAVAPERGQAAALTRSLRAALRGLGEIGQTEQVGKLELGAGDEVWVVHPPDHLRRTEIAALARTANRAVVTAVGGGTLRLRAGPVDLSLPLADARRARLRHDWVRTPGEARRVGGDEWLVLGSSASLRRQPAGVAGARRSWYVSAGLRSLELTAQSHEQWGGDDGRAIEVAAPRAVVAALGPPPAAPSARTEWQVAAVAIVQARARWPGTDVGGPQARAPKDPAEARRWRLDQAELDRLVRRCRTMVASLDRRRDRTLGVARAPLDRTPGSVADVAVRSGTARGELYR